MAEIQSRLSGKEFEKELIFRPLDAALMKDSEIAQCLRHFADDFPFAGDNYFEPIMVEAIKRMKKAEDDANKDKEPA